MNDIKEQTTQNVQCAGYAHDLALVCSEDIVGTAQVRLQSTLNNLFAWRNFWGLKINTTKTTYTVFSLSLKPQKAGGHRLQEEPNPTYLGVKFDQRPCRLNPCGQGREDPATHGVSSRDQ